MSYFSLAAYAAAAAMTVGGALGAVSNGAGNDQPKAVLDQAGGVMNPMIGGQAMLPNRTLLENISASPEHTTLAAEMKESGVADALKSGGEFTVFAPTNAALANTPAQQRNKAQLARMMGYLVVPGRYDSQTLLRVIGENGGQVKLHTVEGGTLVAQLNGPTNVVLMDEKGETADISIYDIYDRNGVIQVVDHALQPGAASGQMASR
ncbi:MAG TPA: fasciclin domain-containing protein [Rhizomicrobium sp.]|nr:fasciclin domain-containing protein [Rhizomicrobium sp.]